MRAWILAAVAVAMMVGCGAGPVQTPALVAGDAGGFPSSAAPGSACTYTGTCADGQCAPSPWSPAGAHFNIGCCVRGDVCRNAGEQAVCAFEIAYPEGGFLRFCIDCGNGLGLRCGL